MPGAKSANEKGSSSSSRSSTSRHSLASATALVLSAFEEHAQILKGTRTERFSPSEAISSMRVQLPVPQWLISIELVKRFLAGRGFWV